MFILKENGKLRLIINYRQFNEIIIKDWISLLLISKLKNRLYGAKWFITLNLKNGYYYIKIKPKHKWKTVFRIKYGLFKNLIILFELINILISF